MATQGLRGPKISVDADDIESIPDDINNSVDADDIESIPDDINNSVDADDIESIPDDIDDPSLVVLMIHPWWY
ncbi:hypothetical protein RclHR1_27190001 [Rhizophagus clarus]|uniref:Uncharacterized protein n=1 Tax=Rhizophagus clarus TaxID=94130 RepID=A0A2Z6R2U3_9GLOM|nr:hypothetical protein RclHR1_27190001 [Rhizophagus clarus]